MNAIEFIRANILADENEMLGRRFKGQPTMATSLRLPCELVAYLDVLKGRLGETRKEVVVLLLEIALSTIEKDFPGFDVVDAEAEALTEHYIELVNNAGDDA